MFSANERGAHIANRLLAAANDSDFAILQRHLEIVRLAPRTVLTEAEQPVRYIYFPHTAVVCLMAVMEESGVGETATVGAEGLVGLEVLLGKTSAASRTLVQISGTASRVSARELALAIRGSATLRALLLRYVAAFLVQVTQSVACNNMHRLDERCSRWLLMAHDRAGRDQFNITQKFLADVLGVHRPTVTNAARALQAAGLIRYTRGVLTILDRERLERRACECYGIVKGAYEEIFA